MRDRHDDPSAQDPLMALKGVGHTTPGDGATRVDATTGGEEVEAAGSAASATGTAEVGRVGAVAADAIDPVVGISDALATGAIDPETARSRLIDAVVTAQMPAGADPVVWQEIRADVEALLAGDPTLMDLLRT